MGEVFGK